MFTQGQSQYGSAGYLPMDHDAQMKFPIGEVRRSRRVNLLAVVANVFLPSLFFALIFSIMSFSMHYQHQGIVYPITVFGGIIVFLPFLLAYRTYIKRQSGWPDADPSWFLFSGISLLFALIGAVVLGDLNFWYHMQPVYDIENLNVYPSVNPSKERGGQLMDAGRVYFTDGTRLDLTMSMRFRNYDQYCVAPIVHGTSPQDSNDFWAVGLNCCDGATAEFRCGEFNNPKARSGLRLMRDNQRPFFRLAVQQAEAAYGLKAPHPVFFYWMQDPTAELSSYRDDGYKQFSVGVFTHFSFNLLCVVLAIAVFQKMG